MNSEDYKISVVLEDLTLVEVIDKINENELGCVFVINNDYKLVIIINQLHSLVN